MKTIFGISNLKQQFKNPVIAIGVFDGLHRGHQLLIKTVVKKARAIQGTPMVMTFDPHPVHVLRPLLRLPLIISLSYRLKLIEQLGIQVCIVVRFTKRFSRFSPNQFIKSYLIKKIRPRMVIIGNDFRFGQHRRGSLDSFQQAGMKFGFQVLAVQAMKGRKKTVSSTRIRQLIAQGKLQEASKLLGRSVGLWGRVVKGEGRGKTLGYPTANILPLQEAIPPTGVYLVKVTIDKRTYPGIANIGQRPSFQSLERVIIEAYIFDFEKDIYGKEILVEFIKKMRDEKQFTAKEALIRQIQSDEKKARKWFGFS